MGLIKIRLNTWDRKSNRDTKFKRGTAPREGFIELCKDTKQVSLKPGDYKWKPWDTGISRKEDSSYIQSKKDMYSGLCFQTKKQAKQFMEKHKEELDKIAAENPLFTSWSVMQVIKRFTPEKTTIYGKDITED